MDWREIPLHKPYEKLHIMKINFAEGYQKLSTCNQNLDCRMQATMKRSVSEVCLSNCDLLGEDSSDIKYCFRQGGHTVIAPSFQVFARKSSE